MVYPVGPDSVSDMIVRDLVWQVDAEEMEVSEEIRRIPCTQ